MGSTISTLDVADAPYRLIVIIVKDVPKIAPNSAWVVWDYGLYEPGLWTPN